MKKILIAGGDSLTDKNYKSNINPEIDTSWPKWPELLAEKLDMECINVAKSGYGNDYIYESVLETIANTDKERIGLVITGWSQAQRYTWQEGRRLEWEVKIPNSDGDIFGWTKRSLMYYLSYQNLCQRWNLKYLHFQTIPLFSSWLEGSWPDDVGIIRHMKQSKPAEEMPRIKYPGNKKEDHEFLENMVMDFQKHIDINSFVGWPGLNDLGGYCLEHETTKGSLEIARSLRISDYDSHPNAKGQIKMMEFLYEKINS